MLQRLSATPFAQGDAFSNFGVQVKPDLGKIFAGLSPRDLQPAGAGYAPSQGFVQFRLPDRRRGGLLGQASVLTISANGVDTSPVVRGAGLLENILGAPPSPPPSNIPVIEPDTRGTTPQWDRLQKHRNNPSCLGLDRQIEPPGFALESFDAIGGWRAHYQVNDKALLVDPSVEFCGTAFKDMGGFKDALLLRQPQFARCLVEKLLIHALGREATPADRPAIRDILDRSAAGDYLLRGLLLMCSESSLLVEKSRLHHDPSFAQKGVVRCRPCHLRFGRPFGAGGGGGQKAVGLECCGQDPQRPDPRTSRGMGRAQESADRVHH